MRRERQRFADREEREAQHRRESCSQCGEHGKHAENCPGWEVRRGEEEVSGRTLLVINPRNKDAPGCSFGIPAPIADWLLRVLAADKKGEI